MKILVTGATGFIGTHLVDELLRAGMAVRALVRNPDDAYLLSAQGAELAAGDITEKATLAEACQGIGAVCHLAATHIRNSDNAFNKINVEGTRNVLAASADAKVERFVYLTPLARDKNAFLRSKSEAARIVETGSVPWTVFHSTPVFGSRGGFLAHLAAFYRANFMAFLPGSGKIKLQPIYVRNLTGMIASALSRPETANRRYDVAGPRVYTLVELADMVARHTGRRLARIHLPRVLVRANSYLVGRMTDRTMLDESDFAVLTDSDSCDPYDASRELDVPLTSVEQAISIDPWPHFARSRRAPVHAAHAG